MNNYVINNKNLVLSRYLDLNKINIFGQYLKTYQRINSNFMPLKSTALSNLVLNNPDAVIKSLNIMKKNFNHFDFYNKKFIFNSNFLDSYKILSNPHISAMYEARFQKTIDTLLNVSNQYYLRENMILNENFLNNIKLLNSYENFQSIKLNKSFNLSVTAFDLLCRFTEINSTSKETASLDISNEIIDKVAESIESDIILAPKSRLSVEFYINLVLTLLLTIYTQILGSQTEEKILSRIELVQKKIIEELNSIKDGDGNYSYYITTKTTQLRNKPNLRQNSKLIAYLYPNQKIRLVENKGEWVKVEIFNHLLNQHSIGWCKKKYLKKLILSK